MGTKANVLVGISAVSVDGGDIGYTEGGVEIEKSVEIYEKEVDQELDALDLIPTKFMMVVRTSFAEATLANIKHAWNEASAIAANTLHLGLRQALPEHELIFTGNSPLGGARTFTLYRAIFIGTVGQAYVKGDKTVLPVELRCLPDLAKALDSRYGKIVDA